MKTDAILSPRQRELVFYLVRGLSVKEAANAMNVIYQCAANHLQNIYDITGVHRTVNSVVSWWYQVNFSIVLPESTKKVIACILLLICLPRELLTTEDSYRKLKRGREIEALVRLPEIKEL